MDLLGNVLLFGRCALLQFSSFAVKRESSEKNLKVDTLKRVKD